MKKRAAPSVHPDAPAVEVAAGIVDGLRALRSEVDIAGQRRFGITSKVEQLGVKMDVLRAIGRRHRRDHALALELWKHPVQEARMAAVFVDDPKQVTRAQMESWARDFDNWALVDGCCLHLFRKTPFALDVATAWIRRRDEFVKRAGFVLVATSAVHRKDVGDDVFRGFLQSCVGSANDDRNFVRKSVNWAIRQIGKRNARLGVDAIATAEKILALDTPTARWIARDALRELRGRVDEIELNYSGSRESRTPNAKVEPALRRGLL